MKKILLLLAEGFEIYEASAFIDVMGWNLLEGDKSTKLYSCGLKREIRSTFGQKIVVDFMLGDIRVEEFAALAIPGGFEEYDFYQDAFDPKFSDLIRKFYRSGKLISSICTGALPIAKSGILKRGTTYNKNPKRHDTLKSMGVEVVNLPIVVDGNITTSWNPSTAMEVAFLLLENLTSKENATKIKILMGYE